MSAVIAAPRRHDRPARGVAKPGDACARVSPEPESSEPESSLWGSSARGHLTLEQRLDGVWEALRVTGTAECPICHGELCSAPAGRAAGMPVRCARCRSTIS